MIKSIKVKGLNGRHDFDLEFNDDLNIITGKNGCGKTSLMKLIWFLYSGNLELALDKCVFDELKVTYSYGLEKEEISIKKDVSKKEFFIAGVLTDTPNFKLIVPFKEIDRIDSREVFYGETDSFFFPTFRRYEGGFSVLGESSPYGLRDSLENFSGSLSTKILSKNIVEASHTFIATISTDDIKQLLSSKYASMLEEVKNIEEEQSQFILEGVKSFGSNAVKALKEIQKKVEEVEKKKAEILRPFTTLSKLISEIFKSKGVSITKNLTLGNTKEIISSDKLSAGEKQMLSFLCYNFFADNAVIFIDEPEISLHADWQRMLVPLLMEQNTGNQFFLATHSPFIYSKYPHKEIILDQDKGVTV